MALVAAACTDGDGERARPGPEPTERATTTFATLPPVGSYLYPTEPDTVIIQIVAGAVQPLPVLTIYGDGRIISVDGDQWVQGTLSDIDVQEFFRDADAVGLLDQPLDLRSTGSGAPDIAVLLEVDGLRLRHSFDVAEIERPAALRSFLVQSSVLNEFELADPFKPEAWVSCTDGLCTASPDRATAEDRPVLPHEDLDSVLAGASASGS
ncbi:MAG: hypothetical protein ACR2O6_13430 [Ilumatobacteraceae bacterium]